MFDFQSNSLLNTHKKRNQWRGKRHPGSHAPWPRPLSGLEMGKTANHARQQTHRANVSSFFHFLFLFWVFLFPFCNGPLLRLRARVPIVKWVRSMERSIDRRPGRHPFIWSTHTHTHTRRCILQKPATLRISSFSDAATPPDGIAAQRRCDRTALSLFLLFFNNLFFFVAELRYRSGRTSTIEILSNFFFQLELDCISNRIL